MEISKKTLLFGLISLCLFFYLHDIFKQPMFNELMQNKLAKAFGSNTTHTFVRMLENSTTQLAGMASLSAFTLLNVLPVSFN